MSNSAFSKYFYGFVFLLYFYIAYNTPLTHDDWTWGTSIGLARLEDWFEGYNGRYMGNLVEIVLTRIDWLRVVVMALFAAFLIFLTANQDKEGNQKFNLLLSLFLILCIPTNIFAQTFSWVAGFSNYNTSIVLVLLFVLIINNIFRDEIPQYKWHQLILVIPLGVLTPLFSEHITIYVLIMSISVIAYTFYKFRRFFAVHLTYFVSSLVGAAIMFSNSAYTRIFSGNDDYRSVESVDGTASTSFLKKIFDVYTEQMYPLLFMNNVILNLVISILCIILIRRSAKYSQNLIKERILGNTLIIIFIAYASYKFIVLDIFKISLFGKYTNEFEAAFSLIYFASVCFSVLFYITERNIQHRVIFYLLSAITLALPFLVVTPMGPRVFLATYSFMVMAAIGIGKYLKNNNYVNVDSFKKLMVVACLLLSISYIHVYHLNGSVHRERIALLQDQIEQNHETIILIRLPYEQYFQFSSPRPNSLQYKTFKEYYHVPEEVDIKLISYKDWLHHNKNLEKFR